MSTSYITFILIGITSLISVSAFRNEALTDKLLFYPYEMKERKEWWRFISHGFVHGDFQHLIFNMLTLFFFGPFVEETFRVLFASPSVYPLFYIGALLASSVPSYFKHRNNPSYRALGASGAIAAVLFTTILFDPWQTLYIKFIIPVPAIVFAVGYIWYSSYMGKHAQDHIGHDAHLWGSVYGFLVPIVLKPGILPYFIDQLAHPHW
ncbi:MAG TPA: rhomboid family intramembrane serine protease [Chitinophagaceae bacterium]|nr:rhomboid family intramembrane serine protease [Chitinophagaceae bacterium]